MFGSTPIRYLTPSEEFYATAENFIGMTLTLHGPVDVGAMSQAFETLLQVHPAHAGHLDRPGADGRHQIMVDDYEHQGMWVEKLGETPAQRLPDQSEALLNLRLRVGADRSELTLYTHHALADAHHQFALLEKLFGWYTDIVGGVGVGPVVTEPIPESLEAVLTERGIEKLQRFGLERYLPAMFAYELPPSNRNAGAGPRSARVPSATCRLSHQESRDLLDVCAARRVSVNAMVAASILLAEWNIRDTPHLPIPYMYPVDLRFFLTPPVGATQATNPVGMAMYLAEITPRTDILDLARDIVEAFRADLADGVIQQSFLHFGSQYQGNPPGLPDVVMTTDGGELPALRTPPGLTVEQYDVEVLFASASAGVDMYTSAMYDGRVVIGYHSHGPEPERHVREIHDLLADVPSRCGWITE
ncbi:phthiocerol/phthiodiolone dimycocerosyl transferase [Mycobacterium antarcticum]|uniref:phthiocerol/phthiodiolone dimycocerosyl transferase family protein n=1 Tax=unclassified Mycolicibacterium TaxID=2636767 RepID=UPI00239D42A1|nr:MULTISPECIES: acyltransferase [unclassified Mycolicibacterium]BDX34625.1 phthiocerol/phthiodiolone dimycocerosyl transferase [Mycolicibacterium sp. TUM20985]GLP81771.1 phthiocerol/phthiodiolone dimycocerosyl transferase [Mycolicibacterium sp. TUM20984]